MKAKLSAFLVFVIVVSGCGSSSSPPEETKQVKAQELAESAQEDVQDASDAVPAPDEGGDEDGNNQDRRIQREGESYSEYQSRLKQYCSEPDYVAIGDECVGYGDPCFDGACNQDRRIQREGESYSEYQSRLLQYCSEPDYVAIGDECVGYGDPCFDRACLATAELKEKIGTSLNQWIEGNGAPGASLAVLLPDGTEILTAAGVRDLRAEGAATTEDYWRIASISKPITSAVVLRLVEQGLIDVDATVATYLGDEWATGYTLGGVDYAPLITIRQILDHTDGFREYAFDPGFYLMVSNRLDVPMDPQEVVDWAFSVGPQYVPGTEYAYNTVGHIIAGLVIEAVTGKTAHEAMRELIFDPAGVTELYLTPGEWPPTYVPAMYVQGELASLISLLPGLAPYLDAAEVGDFLDLSVGPQEVLTSAPWTGGGIEAQMGDLARFFKAMFDGTVLQEETVELFSETALDTSYALGIQLSERVGYRTFEHGGGVPGFRSHARYFPDLDVSIALSTNLIPVDPDVGQLADTVTQLVLDALEEAGWEVPSPIGEGQNEEAPEDPNAGTTGS